LSCRILVQVYFCSSKTLNCTFLAPLIFSQFTFSLIWYSLCCTFFAPLLFSILYFVLLCTSNFQTISERMASRGGEQSGGRRVRRGPGKAGARRATWSGR
jgi:hypothetical protein